MKAVIARDLALALRAGGGFGLALAFFLIAITLVPIGVGPDTDTLRLIAPGVLWIGALLSCLLSLDRIFHLDWEDGSLEALASAPLPFEALALAKALAHWLTTGLPLVVFAPVLGVLLNLAPEAYLWQIATLLAGTPALSALGTFGAALTIGIKRGGLLMSLLVLPLYVPTLLFGATTVSRASQGLDPSSSFALLAGLSLLTLAAMPFAAGAVLRINLR